MQELPQARKLLGAAAALFWELTKGWSIDCFFPFGTGIVDGPLNSCLGATFLPFCGTWNSLGDNKATETSFSCQRVSDTADPKRKAMWLPLK
jgi:hypothetical protein